MQTAPATRCDVFDAQGRAEPPLLTIVHPSRERALDAHPRTVQRRRVIGWSLIIGGALLLIRTYRQFPDIEATFPGVIGINLVLAGGRLLWFNLGSARPSGRGASGSRGRSPAAGD